MSELGQRIGRASGADGGTPSDPEWSQATKEALERKGVRFLHLGRTVDEILATHRVDLDRDADDYIHSRGLRQRTPVFSEVGILPAPISTDHERRVNNHLYALEDRMLEMALELGQGLTRPDQQGYLLVNGDFPDVLDAFTQLEVVEVEGFPHYPSSSSWTNTRVAEDRFLAISIGGDRKFYVSTLRAKEGYTDLIPLIVPVPVNPKSGVLFYPQIPDGLRSQTGQ